MSSNVVQIRVFDNETLVFSTEVAGPLELGRQRSGEGEPFSWSDPGLSGTPRLVVAGFNETNVSRRHVLLMPSHGRVRVANISKSLPVVFEDGDELAAGLDTELQSARAFALGDLRIQVGSGETESQHQVEPPTTAAFEQLSSHTLLPGQTILSGEPMTRLQAVPDREEGVDVEQVVRWLQSALGALESAATSRDFYARAAEAVVEMAGLDSGYLLMKDGNDWRPVASHSADNNGSPSEFRPSRQVIDNVCDLKRTLWQKPQRGGDAMASLAEVESVVAAPILNAGGEVQGILYGDRRTHTGGDKPTQINKLEAMLVELLAWGVAAGLARQEQELQVLAARIQFEQFFSPELTAQLELEPDLLEGKDAEVSVLFADIRGFSRISERLGPAGTVEWIRETMSTLSDCVLARQGVLVDYVGDELMAMWGAPKEQPDHAALASRAALDMLAALPELNARWEERLGEPVAIGIGINSGIARVGNTGSDRKFKYGPLGGTVNLASRVQGSTKYLKSKLIVTAATRSRLGDDFRPRRLCSVRVVNIEEPVELFAIAESDGNEKAEDKAPVRAAYEKALAEFEKGHFEAAAQRLGQVLANHPGDGPSLVLMSRTIKGLIEGPDEFHPVWELPGK